MRLSYGVAIATPTLADPVHYLVCADDTPRVVSSFSKLPHGVRWWTNHSVQQLYDAGFRENPPLADSFLGVRMSSIALEWGLDPARLEMALPLLTKVLASVLEVAELMGDGQVIERTLLAHLQPRHDTIVPSVAHRKLYDALCHPTLVRPDALPKASAGGRIIPLRRYRPRHLHELLPAEIPDESSVVIETEEGGVLDTLPDEWTLYCSQPPAADSLFAAGPFAAREAWLLSEEIDLMESPPPHQLLRVQSTMLPPWAGVLTRLSLTAPDLAGGIDSPLFTAGPLTLQGPAALSYAIGLVTEGFWRAWTLRPSALAAFLHARDRWLTAISARNVADALAEAGLGDRLMLRRWRSGSLWLESTIQDPEEERSVVSALAEETELLHPMWPAVVTASARYTLGCELLSQTLQPPRPELALLGLHALGRSIPQLI